MVKTTKKSKTIRKSKIGKKGKQIEKQWKALGFSSEQEFREARKAHADIIRGEMSGKSSSSAKQIANSMSSFRDRRITAWEIQKLMNKLKARGTNWEYVDFKEEMDTSLTVSEAKNDLLRKF